MLDLTKEADARFWDTVYSRGDAYSSLIRERHATALCWAKSLALSPGASALEVGCGSGALSLALARLGLAVNAVDHNEHLAAAARRRLSNGNEITSWVLMGDAHRLPFRNNHFELAIALGVLGWLKPPQQFVSEVARVLAPGGYFLVSAANRYGLSQIFDPFQNPLLGPICYRLLDMLKRVFYPIVKCWPIRDAGNSHSSRYVLSMLRAEGFEVRRRTTLGFGPFGIHGRPVLPDAQGVRLQRCLQHLSESGRWGLEHVGTQLLFLAQKPEG